jgi:hypothetical protein
MKALHLMNKKRPDSYKREGLTPVPDEPNHYVSCCWDLDLKEYQNLVGGMLYLHNSKSEKSFMGGVVKKVERIDLKVGSEYYDPSSEARPARTNRIQITFESTREGRQISWRGMNHAMAWASGLIDV